MTRSSNRPVKLVEVARAAGVHVSTASRALAADGHDRLASDTVTRVRTAAERLGYRRDEVATGLRSGSTMSVGVVVPNLENPFQGPVLRGISAVLDEHSHLPLVVDTVEDSARFARIADHLLGRRVSAIVASAARAADLATVEQILAGGVPVVLAVRGLDGIDVPMVTADERAGARAAAEHLLALGHRRVAQLRGPLDILPFVQRAEAFRTAFARGGGVDVTVVEPPGQPTVEAGQRMMAETLEAAPEPPTAIFAHTDVMAIGAIRALREHGLSCPRDVSVMGFDNAPLTDAVDPPLTTVELPGERLGREAAALALALVEGRPAESLVVPTRLIERASTAPPPAT